MPRKEAIKPPRFSLVRFGIRVAVAGVILVTALYAWNRTEHFLIHDPRFAVAIPEFGVESSSLQITGVRHTSRLHVLRIFSPDYGRSIYLLPMKERQEQLRKLDWIRDASIARLWPNKIAIQVTEREPVAFVTVQPEGSRLSRFCLIDIDGVILQPPAQARFTLPVALGIKPSTPIAERRGRVRRVAAVMREAGPFAERISEVDVADFDNIKVTAKAGQYVVVLELGDRNFLSRLQNFFNNYGRIQERLMSKANLVDLRVEDRITVVEGGSGRN